MLVGARPTPKSVVVARTRGDGPTPSRDRPRHDRVSVRESFLVENVLVGTGYPTVIYGVACRAVSAVGARRAELVVGHVSGGAVTSARDRTGERGRVTASGRARALVLAGLVVVSAVAVGVPALGERASAQAGGATLVVGGSGSYSSIQSAVDDATDGDTVEVRPGTYAESVTIRKNVTLVAPDGATIANASVSSGAGVLVFGPATPTVSGFTLRGWTTGFRAGGSEGAWTLRDTTIRDTGTAIGAAGTPAAWTVDDVTVVNTTGLSAFQSSGDWVVRDSTFRGDGISADESTGDWTVRDTVVRNDSGEAINAQRSDGRWTVENATLVDNERAVAAGESTGDWTVRDTVVDNATEGVFAENSGGNWTVRNVTVGDVGDSGVGATGSTGAWTVENATLRDVGNEAVAADATAGAWTVRNTTVRNAGEAVDASGATVAGDATRNYWGAADGPSGDFSGSGEAAVGNVSVEPFYTDAALTTLGTFGTGGASVANVTLANPAERTLEVTVTTTGPVSGLSVDLGNTTTTTGTDLALADGEFTETALGDGRYTYVASATADVADGTSSTYRASVTSVDGRAVGAGALQTSQSLSVAAARTTNGAATVRTGSTTVPEATVTLDGGVESNVTVSTADTVPDVPGQRETALRADLAAVDEDDVVVSALTVNVDREDADTPATLRLRVAADAVGGDPAGLVVARNDGAGYGTLDTAVVETSDDTVVLEARSPEGLSVFAVVDTDESLATTPTPDEGGGGGGGGGAAGAFAVDQRSVTERVDDAAVSSVTVEFDGETTGSVQIRAGESLPAGAPDPDGTVLTVVDVSPPADVADRPGRVTVTLARTAVGDVDPSRLRIVRYADGSLRPLSTRLVRADGRLVVLSAATAGYGSFAVVVGDQRTTAAPSATPDQTTTPGPTATPTPGSGPTATPTASPSPTPAAGDGFGVVAALVAVLAAALLVRRRAG
jgi:pectinesterase